MSRRFRREPFAADHERARELAAQRVDGPVTPDDAGWLGDHLAWCGPCRAVAKEYDEQRLALRALRHDAPVPPRDLWARTAAAIEAEPGHRRPAAGRRRSFVGYVPLVAALVVAVALGGTLLDDVLPPLGSTTKGDDPEATPIDLIAGEIQVLSHADDGSLELLSRNLDQLCPVAAESCGLSNVLDVTHVASIGTDGDLDAIVSPDRRQLVVVESGSGSSSVYVVSLRKRPASSPTPGSDTSTATREPASDDPGTTASVAPASTASPDATDEPASDDPGQSPDPSDEPPASSDNPPSDAAGSPPASAEPTEDPSATDEPVTTPDPTDEPKPEPTPKATDPAPSVEVTPGPDGAIEIARDVVIVGSGAGYSPDGSRFAFSARPAKGSDGPDVFVWHVGDRLAKAVTTDHGSQLAGWVGERLLISRVVDGKPRTSILDLDDGSQRQAGDGAMWRPTVGPGRELATWWDGTVKQADDGITWVPDRGRLVLANWPDGSDSQVLAEGAVTDWDVAWDETGTKLAVWVSRDDPGKPGKLSLYTVDEATGRPDLARPPLDGAPAYAGFALEPGRLAWSSPADGGDTSVVVLGWSGNNFGKVTLPTENGATVLR